MVSYSYHRCADKFRTDNNVFLKNYGYYWCYLNDKNTTFLTFSQWKTLYEGDPEGWYQAKDEDNDVICPCYIKINEKGNRCWNEVHFIKFLHKRDFKKWLKFLESKEKKDIKYDNLQEIIELSNSVRQAAKMRLEESQKQVQIQYNEMQELLEKNTSSVLDSVQTTPIPTLVFRNGKTYTREVDENGKILLKER